MSDYREIRIPDVVRSPLLDNNRLNPAQSVFEKLVREINEFEKYLSQDEEIGGRFVASPHAGTFHILDVKFRNPDVIVFYGEDADGHRMRLVQHHSQVSVLLCALPIVKDEPRRIGFVLHNHLSSGSEP
jgi:hypothetical protein